MKKILGMLMLLTFISGCSTIVYEDKAKINNVKQEDLKTGESCLRIIPWVLLRVGDNTAITAIQKADINNVFEIKETSYFLLTHIAYCTIVKGV